jgi:hypothetical protein
MNIAEFLAILGTDRMPSPNLMARVLPFYKNSDLNRDQLRSCIKWLSGNVFQDFTGSPPRQGVNISATTVAAHTPARQADYDSDSDDDRHPQNQQVNVAEDPAAWVRIIEELHAQGRASQSRSVVNEEELEKKTYTY